MNAPSMPVATVVPTAAGLATTTRIAEVAAPRPTASKGSSTQQVGDLTLLSLTPSFRQQRPEAAGGSRAQRRGVPADSTSSELTVSGVEVARSQGMYANSDVRYPLAQQRHRKAVVAVMARGAAIGSLIVYAGGVRLLLRHLAFWLASCEQIARRALGLS